jgi:radical SAM protein with 4Fe4S-binding SPASM domain
MIFDKDFNVVYLRVVQGCNLNCSHCFTLGNKDPILMTELSLIQNFLQAIKTNVDPKKITFYIHGGETFLASYDHLRSVNQLIHQIFPDAEKNIIPQTNLIYKVDDEYIQFLKNEYNSIIGVSWDAEIRFGSIAINKKTSQEDLFFTNFHKLVDAGIEVNVAITAQKNLLNYKPIELATKFAGAASIDFELLTVFDEQSNSLKPNNVKWSNWLDELVDYYQHNDTTWCLPQVDLFTKTLMSGQIYDCKCNCCDKRTFTLNPNGTVGLCPDKTYVEPFSTVNEMMTDWASFENKSLDVVIKKLVDKDEHVMCYSCEHYDICGGNCEITLFDETEECPLSKKVISRVRNNINTFTNLYKNKAKINLVELRTPK